MLMQDQNIPVEDVYKQGQTLLESGNPRNAAACFQAILNSDPDHAPSVKGLGLALLLIGKFAEAVPCLEKATQQNPRDPAILEALGVACSYTGRNAEAETVLRKSLRFGRNNPETMANLAAVLNENGKFDEAESMLRACLRKVPDNLQAQHNLALLKLLKGDLEQGWPGFELRNVAAGKPLTVWAQACDAPVWQGEDIGGRSILLYAEQGLGDTIQFVRYANVLAARGAKVVVQCQRVLIDILSTVAGVSRCISIDEDAGEVDYKASVLSIPMLLKTTLDTVPSDVPYIHVFEDASAPWAERLRHIDDKPKIGLVWAGNPDNKTDHKRSMSLHVLKPIMSRPDWTFVSLQVGAAADQVLEIEEALKPYILFPEILPFTDVAAAIKNLDLLITVDTALAHLAGAIGTPVWTMITHFPDWRWLLQRDDTPWYPTMRLFRQPIQGDWESVIENVGEALDTQSFR